VKWLSKAAFAPTEAKARGVRRKPGECDSPNVTACRLRNDEAGRLARRRLTHLGDKILSRPNKEYLSKMDGA
jgi:hypothetical protein